jgi:hypothetical protein
MKTNSCIYFERITINNGSMFQAVQALIGALTTPRKLIEFVKEVSSIVAYIRVIFDHKAQLR